jgi:hypothetical protein
VSKVRVLSDSGYSVPVLSSEIVKWYQVPEFKRSTPLVVEQFDRLICPDIGYSYTYLLNWNLDHHWSRESLNVGPTDDDYTIMMPWWWMLAHALTMSSGSKVQYKYPNCKRDCSKIAVEKRDIEYDDTMASDSGQY